MRTVILELFAFQFCLDFLQLARWSVGCFKTCRLGTADGLCYWLQNARQKIFHRTKVHIIKVSLIRHLHVQIRVWALGSRSDPRRDRTFFVFHQMLVWFLFETPHSECIQAAGDCPWCSVFSLFGFRLPTLAVLDCSLLLGWIKCATDRGGGSAVTRWVELSATCCLCVVKTGGGLISPGSPKLDRPTCCPDPSLIFPLTFLKSGVRGNTCGKDEDEGEKKKTSMEF